jgi:ATP dependent DNA ligase domain
MYALAVQNIPEGKEWFYEVKFDGYRCLAGRDKNGVTLWSRRGNVFTTQFPHVARGCERLPNDTLLDGEIVAIDQAGRISFNLLQHHRSHATSNFGGLRLAFINRDNTIGYRRAWTAGKRPLVYFFKFDIGIHHSTPRSEDPHVPS